VSQSASARFLVSQNTRAETDLIRLAADTELADAEASCHVV